MKMIPTRAANASSVNLTHGQWSFLGLNQRTSLPCEISDNSRTIHSNDYKTEEGRPKSNPEAHCEIIDSLQRDSHVCVHRISQTWIKLAFFQLTITVAELHKDLLKDEHLGRNMKYANEEKTLSGFGEKKRCLRPSKRMSKILGWKLTGPVQPRTVKGCPPNKQNTPPAIMWPKKDSMTPCR